MQYYYVHGILCNVQCTQCTVYTMYIVDNVPVHCTVVCNDMYTRYNLFEIDPSSQVFGSVGIY